MGQALYNQGLTFYVKEKEEADDDDDHGNNFASVPIFFGNVSLGSLQPKS